MTDPDDDPQLTIRIMIVCDTCGETFPAAAMEAARLHAFGHITIG